MNQCLGTTLWVTHSVRQITRDLWNEACNHSFCSLDTMVWDISRCPQQLQLGSCAWSTVRAARPCGCFPRHAASASDSFSTSSDCGVDACRLLRLSSCRFPPPCFFFFFSVFPVSIMKVGGRGYTRTKRFGFVAVGDLRGQPSSDNTVPRLWYVD